MLLRSTKEQLAVSYMNKWSLWHCFQLPLAFTLKQVLFASASDRGHIKIVSMAGWVILASHVVLGARMALHVFGALHLAVRHLSARLLVDSGKDDRFLRRLGRVNLFVRQELCLHLVCVNIREMMEDIFAKIWGHFFGLLQASMQLLSLIERVVATQGLPLTFGVLLEKQRRGSYLVDDATSAHPDGHAALFAIKHKLLHVQMLLWLSWSMSLCFSLWVEIWHLLILSPWNARAIYRLKHSTILGNCLALFVSPSQFSGSLK